MRKKDAVDLVIRRCRERNLALSTERTYAGWIADYCDWRLMEGNREQGPGEFLSWLAGVKGVAIGTQKQALNGLNFFYKHCLGRELGRLDFRGARVHRRAPVWLSREECEGLFAAMAGVVPRLQAMLMYGTGLRRSELLGLRIKDLDFAGGTVTVRSGKGGKDRVVPMPVSLRAELREQVERARGLWRIDRANGWPGPEVLPLSLVRKFGRKRLEEFDWFWLWPAAGLSRCPRSGVVRRHHLTERSLVAALDVARRRAGIAKRVSPHVLRHSFATAMLLGGLDLKGLSVLMGHASVSTTEVYLHALPQLAARVVSPMDQRPGNVIEVGVFRDGAAAIPGDGRDRSVAGLG